MDAQQFAVLLAGYIINCVELGTFKSLGVFYLDIQQEMDTTNVALGSWMAMYEVATVILAPATVVAAKRHGPRTITVIGGILSCVALCFASQTQSVHWFGFFVTISGLGSCLSHQSVTFAIPQYFQQNMNSAFGFMSAGAAIGMMIFPPILQFLSQQYGWRGAFMLLGAINAHNIVCGYLLRSRNITNSEYEPIDSQNGTEVNSTFKKSDLQKTISFLQFLFIDNPAFIFLLAVDILSGLLFAAWVIFLIPHSATHNISQRFSAFLSTFGAIGALIGRLLMGPVIKSGFVTALQLYVVLGILNAIAFYLDVLSDNFIILSTLSLINGLACGTLVCLSFGGSAEILGEEHVVEGYSVASLTYPVGSLIGGSVLGHYFDEESVMSFPFLGGVSIAVSLLMSIIAVPWKKTINSCSKS